MTESLRSLAAQYTRGGAQHVLKTYLRLHRNKLFGEHWIWAALERIAAAESEREVMADYGYVPENRR